MRDQRVFSILEQELEHKFKHEWINNPSYVVLCIILSTESMILIMRSTDF